MKKVFILFFSFVVLIALVACGDQESSAGGASEELTEIDIMLDWYPNAVHSYLYAALENGYFEEEGLKVNIQFPANPTDPINLAASGQITLGITYQPDVITARANQDVPIKSIGVIVRSPLNHTIFLEDSPLRRPKDLEGKTIGYPGTPVNQALIKTMVETDGGNPEKVQLIDVGFELGSSLVTGRVDAVTGAYINHEVPVLKHEGYKTRHFNPVEYGVPSFYQLLFVTSDETWETQSDIIRAFWRGATKGYDFMVANPDEALDILLRNQDAANFPLIEEVEKQSLEILFPKMESTDGFGSQDVNGWQETIDWMKKFGIIDVEPSLEDIFVNIVD
ncbi:putative hydroxymethylpyrimidine transport system substrate-binding protein [Evansella vedderi]|uniref:Hydroxymethylpyrimidine transport system substrate-binding protein n=1 Tax=Evansella vedderi TaxID=38282 RepID=A0ABU0A0F7_9BACI|nr:ABC transporter substrate-binding protein [Evansella vedderi]MDQ0256978.1 putative hydroxymethylpyrimidine transport system substrate-binding protein [Evansella vedderi]